MQRRILVAAAIVLATALLSGSLTLAAVQQTFVLDLDSASFNFSETSFNDSAAAKEHDFPSGGGDFTCWIRIPRNSTVSQAGLNVTGKIITIYSSQVKSNNAPLGMVTGNVTSWEGNEIITGTSGFDGNITILYGTNGSVIMEHYLSINPVRSIAAGNVTPDPGDEIVAGSDDNRVYVIEVSSGTSQAWNYSTSGDVKALAIGDVYEIGENKVIAGGGSVLYLLNPDGSLNWSRDVGDINDIAAENVTYHPGREIIVGNGTGISAVNSSGHVVWYADVCSVNSLDVMNVTPDPGVEIAVGCSDNKVYLMNTSDTGAQAVWSFTAGGPVVSVDIGDVTSEPGNEVVLGSDDGKVYTLDSSGSLVWDYYTASPMKSVTLGNITGDEGNETVGGAINGYIYTFNFEYFPTNLSADVGANGTADWNYSGTLRENQTISGLAGSFQYYLDSVCTPDAAGSCDVPLLFHSDGPGKLEAWGLAINYSYNATPLLSAQQVSQWSRTGNILANESVGNVSRNVTFLSSPSNDITVSYIRMDPASDVCDFNNTRYSNATVAGDNVCDIADFSVPSSGSLPLSALFWDRAMQSGVPAVAEQLSGTYSYQPGNFSWFRNITLANTTDTVFCNVTVNASIDDSIVKEAGLLRVYWSGSWCNITPDSATPTCDTGSPSYTARTCGSDIFYACKEDTDSSGRIDFFKWVHPSLTSQALYQAGGSINLPANMTDGNVTPASGVWGSYFNFSVFVNDTEDDNVTVLLWLNISDTWYCQGEVNVSGNGTAWFNKSSGCSWVGADGFKFQYQDFNTSTGLPAHPIQNTSVYSGPSVQRHSIQINHSLGNESYVNRSSGYTTLRVYVNDTSTGQPAISGVSCNFSVSTDGANFDSGHQNTTNSSGYCEYAFDPDGNYSAGNQTWTVTVSGNPYYNDSQSENFTLVIQGMVNASLSAPSQGDSLFRNSTNRFAARLIDEYGQEASLPGYNCSFWFGGSLAGYNDTNSSGHCIYDWQPNCSVQALGNYTVNVTINGTSGTHYIDDGEDSTWILMKDLLKVTVLSPTGGSVFHKGDTIAMNSSVNDTCELCSEGDYSVSWELRNYKSFRVWLNETLGIRRENEPLVLNASWLESQSIDLGQWMINHTWVYSGSEIPSEVKAWENESRQSVNTTQVFLNNYSELYFLVNLEPYQNRSYWVYFNDSNPTDHNLSRLSNGGFESGQLTAWNCSNSSCGPASEYCTCEVHHEGPSGTGTGNYSLFLSAESEAGSESNLVSVNQSLLWELGSEYIKIRYKAWGEYAGGAYLRLAAGGGICELPVTPDTPEASASWGEHTCQNASFAQAGYVTVRLHDSLNSGPGIDASHAYIDYICVANSSGGCISLDSGAALGRGIFSSEVIASGANSTWSIPGNETPGNRSIFANASGQFYPVNWSGVYVTVYGYSNVSYLNISSGYCTFGQWTACMQNASIYLLCDVLDVNSSAGIYRHNVSFYGDGTLLGYNLTNASGTALFYWENSTDATGEHYATCNITDDPDVFYNATEADNATVLFNITSGNTTAELVQEPLQENAVNITVAHNHSLTLNLTINNTGNGTMYSPDINISLSQGFSASAAACGNIFSGGSCSVQPSVDVTYTADPVNSYINVTVLWYNEDSSQGNASNSTLVSVENNTVLNVTETGIVHSISRGETATAGNFTVQAFGNTETLNITFNEQGMNASNITQWITYTPSSIAAVFRGASQGVEVNISVPFDTPAGVYETYLFSNASNSSCTPAAECLDSLLLNLTVTPPNWDATPVLMNKSVGLGTDNGTIGVINITNNREVNYSFTIATTGNGTGYISTSLAQINVSQQSSGALEVYHNTSVPYQSGYWFVNITVHNEEQAYPNDINVSVYLNVINLTVDIVSPNQTAPAGPLNASDTLNITVNATLSGSPLTSGLVWTASVGGQVCGNVRSAYNSSAGLWDINCSAPQIAGNVIYNDLAVTGNYTAFQGTIVSDTEARAVAYQDITPPQFLWVNVSDVERGTAYFNLIEVNVTDNSNVSWVWINLTYPNGSALEIKGFDNSSGNYVFNYSGNFSSTGDYVMTVHSNDTSGLSNSTEAWFDVYTPLQFQGGLQDPDGANQTVTCVFYKPGTSLLAANLTATASYNWTLHSRSYDIEVIHRGQRLRFNSANLTLSAENQHNVSGASNLSNPFRIDIFANNTAPDISNIDLPGTAENILMALVIEPLNLSFSTATITIDYTQALAQSSGTFEEGDLRILYCSGWDFQSRSCPAGEFQHLDEGITPNVSANRFVFTTTPSTAYALAESCYPNTCGAAPPSPPGGTTSGTGGVTVTVCGNGRCETGENEANCPEDCAVIPFSVSTSINNIRISPGEKRTIPLHITNLKDTGIVVNFSLEGLGNFITLESESVTIGASSNVTVNAFVDVPFEADTGAYAGTLTLTSGSASKQIPISMMVAYEGGKFLSMAATIVTRVVSPDGSVKFIIELRNIGQKDIDRIRLVYEIKKALNEELAKSVEEVLEQRLAPNENMVFTRSITLAGLDLPQDQYILETWAYFEDKSVRDLDAFDVSESFFVTPFGQILSWVVPILAFGVLFYFGRVKYSRWRLKKKRYIFPVNYSRIPAKTEDSLWLGRIAETDRDAWWNPDDLTTHVLVAGSTGAGKSVGASVFIEELLERKIPVVVFDPTAQWTGFVKPCADSNLLVHYPRFGMDPRNRHSYKGMIFEIEDPHVQIDIDKFMIPGEITVFTMNKLRPGEYDVAVKNIIGKIFGISREESPKLKMVIVFDEVHRLLEKYGGIGGYVALEKACREFRKWGIGLIMCSQVLADFKEAIAGNVLTDVQMNTKSLTDIKKVERKYGTDYAVRISRQGVGVGMFQNPKYNEGKPYFVQFRPTWHSPHKITNEEMEIYRAFSARLARIESRLGELQKKGIDVFDMTLEFKLANSKLKGGSFRMAKIYIDSLEKKLNISE